MALKNIIVQMYFALHYLLGFGQTAGLQPVKALPEDLNECSGMAVLGDNEIAMINDSGHDAELFVCDTSGQLRFRARIPALHNTDWESLAYENGILYIGDFGNNRNTRENLTIYRLQVEAFATHGHIVVLEPITFSYREQAAFPPSKRDMNYDLEAMVAVNDSLYLFTKNRTAPFSGYSYCYALPARAGDYKISRVDSVHTGEGLMASYWITGASYDASKRELLLLGYDKLWRFKNSNPGRFFKEKAEVFYFNHFSQKEAIGHLQGDIYLSDEKNTEQDGWLYKVHLPAANGDRGQ